MVEAVNTTNIVMTVGIAKMCPRSNVCCWAVRRHHHTESHEQSTVL